MKPANKFITSTFLALAILLPAAWRHDPILPGPSRGLKALIVEDVSQKLPIGQTLALLSARSGEIREWLNANCSKDADGNPMRRVWDVKQDVSHESKFWQDAWAKRKPPPSVMLSNGLRGYNGPLPSSPEEFQTLLEKYD